MISKRCLGGRYGQTLTPVCSTPAERSHEIASKRDYYEVLGVSRDTSEREIKRPTKRLGHEISPRSQLQATKPQKLTLKKFKEAYEIQPTPTKRAYDQFGHAGVILIAVAVVTVVVKAISAIFSVMSLAIFSAVDVVAVNAKAACGSDLRYN